jgi:type I restriction enzyme S subunit
MKYRLEQIVDVTMGQSPKSIYYNSNGKGYPFLQGNKTFGLRYPVFDTYTEVMTKAAKAGDVIMSVRAPVGELNITPVDMCLGRGVCSLRMKNGNQDFLYYMMKYYIPHLINKESGTVFGSVSKKDISSLEVDIPEDVEIQRKIARYLLMFDEKIELNEQINKNLAEQSQTIYQQYFITEAGQDWPLGHLSDLVNVKYGKDHKKLADGIYPVYGSGGIMRYVERPLYEKESVLIPRKGTLNNVMYVNQPFWSVDTMFYTEMKQPNVAKFVYHFMKSKDLASMNAGSAVPSMTTAILNALEISIPSAETLKHFEISVAPMYEMMQKNEEQSHKLTKLRDVLLPKLMSGEIDVSTLDL